MEAIIMLRGVICLSLVAIPFFTFSQKVIDYPPKIVVICMDGDTRKPMVGVKVVFRKGDTLVKTCTTDGTGRCLILKPKPGTYYVAATKNTYMEFTLAHVNVPAEQTVILEIPLESDPNSKQTLKKGKLVASTDNPAIGVEF
jgi:hypothetical protein